MSSSVEFLQMIMKYLNLSCFCPTGLERQESEDCGLADTDYTSLKLKFSKLYDILLLGGEKSSDYEAKPNSCKFWFKLTINFLHSHVDTSHDL